MGAVDKLSARRSHKRAEATLEERVKTWWNDDGVGVYEAFPVLFVYSIWEARNRKYFQQHMESP